MAPVGDVSRGVLLDNRYRLEDALGRGGMATVFRARDTVLGRDVAIKLFSAVGEDEGVARHRAEMRILARLNHPGLVTLHDAGSADLGGPHAQDYLVMELVEGPTLADRLGRGPVSPSHTARLGREMAEALSVVHDEGIVHRDLKPANVLLVGSDPVAAGPTDTVTTGPVVKLADFGIARLFDGDRLTATGITLGTACYLSPEQAVGGPVGPATDVYALGLVLLECLTGEKAFTGTVTEVAVARLSTSPPIPVGLGPRWVAVLTGMTQREAADRPTAAQVAQALGEIADAPDADEATREASVVVDGALAAPPGAFRQGAAPRPGAERPRGAGGRRWSGAARRPALVATASILVLASGAWLATQLDRSADAGSAPPSTYPSVDGPLGSALLDLQRSVEP